MATFRMLLLSLVRRRLLVAERLVGDGRQMTLNFLKMTISTSIATSQAQALSGLKQKTSGKWSAGLSIAACFTSVVGSTGAFGSNI